MTNQLSMLIEMSKADRTPAQRDALLLHERLIYDKQMIEVGIVSMCRDLKEIRDGKHYATLGFEDFGEYTEQMHGIGSRQAYKYIRIYEQLGVEILNSSSKIGVTKLLELASLDNEERQELLASHSIEELEDLSAAEVKRLTAEIKRLEEQVSMFEDEKLNSSSKDESALRAEIEAQLRAEYDGRVIEAKQKARSEAEASNRSEVATLKADIKRMTSEMKANNDAIKQAEARAKEAEEKAAQANEFELKFKNAEAEKAAMEKKIRLSSDPELTRFKYLFETWQSATSIMFEQLAKLDKETREKMRGAIKAVMGGQL